MGFGKWYESRFSDICALHDEAYLKRVWRLKCEADLIFVAAMSKRGYPFLGAISLFFFVTLGTLMWIKGFINDKWLKNIN